MAPPDGGPRAARAPSRPLILVVDDDEALRAMIARALARLGFDVDEASDGENILHAFHPRRRAPDVIVSDVNMGRCSGLAALERLRRRGHPTPVVLVSSALDEATRARARALGAEAVLEKPLDLDRLRRLVASLLTGGGAYASP